MNLLKTLLEAQGGGLVEQVANKLGLDREQANSAVASLLPSLAGAMKSNIAKPGGLEGLMGAISSGNHQRYIDNPAELGNEEAIAEGNGILGHLLGSKDVSRQVAAQAASSTGIDVEKLKAMLPMVASMMMGSVSKQASSAGVGASSGMPSAAAALESLGGGGVFGSMLGKFLGDDDDDNSKDSAAGNLFGLAKKLFK